MHLTLPPAPGLTATMQQADGTPADTCWDLTATAPDTSAFFVLSGQANDGVIEVFGFTSEQTLQLTHCRVDGSAQRLLPIAQGRGPSTFGPTNPVTREQMASFLTRALDL